MVRRGTLAFGAAAASAAGAVGAWNFVLPNAPHGAGIPHAGAAAPAQMEPWHSAGGFAQEAGAEAVGGGWSGDFARWVGAGFAAGVVAAACSAPAQAYTSGKDAWNPARNIDFGSIDISKRKNLDLCKDNKKYHKRIKDEIYKVTTRQKKYPKDSVVYNRFVRKVAQIKKREESYGERYCGKKDGLPRVLVNPNVRRGGVVVPALMFLYIAGWIGWAGRSYLLRTKDAEKEYSIDVPLALTCMASGFAWPVNAWQAIVNGEMTKKDTDIYRSGVAAEQ